MTASVKRSGGNAGTAKSAHPSSAKPAPKPAADRNKIQRDRNRDMFVDSPRKAPVSLGGNNTSPIAPGSTYEIQPGDTLNSIAARSGVPMGQIAKANGISNPDLIIAGQSLDIPAAPESNAPSRGGKYTVQPGDTLNAIAARTGVPMTEIAAANGISNPDVIRAGQELIIPDKTRGEMADERNMERQNPIVYSDNTQARRAADKHNMELQNPGGESGPSGSDSPGGVASTTWGGSGPAPASTTESDASGGVAGTTWGGSGPGAAEAPAAEDRSVISTVEDEGRAAIATVESWVSPLFQKKS